MSPVCNSVSFRAEARWQSLCAVCGKGGFFHAHHVVYEQALRRLGIRNDWLYDTRNALRLCVQCHWRHHNHVRQVKTTELKDENIGYAFEVMGLHGADWLRRYYDDSAEDPRILVTERDMEAKIEP